MKILSSDQMRLADEATIRNTPIASIDLMERAGQECVRGILREKPPADTEFLILCGVGNNGGDGLVIARLLANAGFKVRCFVLEFSKTHSADFDINLERLRDAGLEAVSIRDEQGIPGFQEGFWIIDSIFGTGLNRPPEGMAREVIKRVNASGARVISIDFPSGLFSHAPVEDDEAVIRASLTLTFQQPKLAFLLPMNADLVGRWELLDIGLDRDFIDSIADCHELVDSSFAGKLLRVRGRFSHKGSYGHSLLIGGSYGKVGAMILASKAALRAGSGLVSAYIPKCGYTALQTANPEVMTEVDDEFYIQFFNFRTRPTSIGIGPGLGTHLKTKKGFVEFLRGQTRPLVLDADALNIISEHDEIKELIPPRSILTPHPGEFERLAGAWKDDFEKLKKQQDFAQKHDCILVLKGAYTSIANGGQLYFNGSGNPALATAGSGDVLTGMLTGLLAQGYSSLEASLLGVYLHGRSADIATGSEESRESFIASDILRFLGRAIKDLPRG